jgi:hypothetical protein
VRTNSQGIATFTRLPQGCYTFHTAGFSVLSLLPWWFREHDPRARCGRRYQQYNPLYHHARRTVCVDGSATTYTAALPVVPRCRLDQLRVVLTWNRNPADLDLSVAFQTTSRVCLVGYFRPACELVTLDTQCRAGGDTCVETITVTGATRSVFQFAVNLFGLASGLYRSGAQIEVYSYASDFPVATFNIPAADPNGRDLQLTNRWWNVFCIDGRNRPMFDAVTPLQFFSPDRVDYTRNCTLLQVNGRR